MEKVIFAIIGISDRAAPINNFFRQTDKFFEKGKNATAAIVQARTVNIMKKKGVIWGIS